MIIDQNAVFSGSIVGNTVTGQALTSGTITSTNVYDLQQVRDLGKGEEMEIPIEVIQTFTGGTSLIAQVVQADDAGITTNVNVIQATGPITTAQLVAGARFYLAMPANDPNINRRYLAVQYVITGTYTAGSVFASLEPSNIGVGDNNEFYPSGFSVL